MTKKNNFDFDSLKSVLIVGASGGIGYEVLSHVLTHAKDACVFATYRESSKIEPLNKLKNGDHQNKLHLVSLNADKEEDYKNLADYIGEHEASLDLVINCIGYLHGNTGGPEKRLSDIDLAHLTRSFEVNALPVVLLAKHLFSFLRSPFRSFFISLSARVGSIDDNRAGGWYSYRASKAAHNMFVKNIALEFDRFRTNTLVTAFHPGTTKTSLSKPYIKNTKYQLHDPAQTASNLFSVISGLTDTDQGAFLDWKGEVIKW